MCKIYYNPKRVNIMRTHEHLTNFEIDALGWMLRQEIRQENTRYLFITMIRRLESLKKFEETIIEENIVQENCERGCGTEVSHTKYGWENADEITKKYKSVCYHCLLPYEKEELLETILHKKIRL